MRKFEAIPGRHAWSARGPLRFMPAPCRCLTNGQTADMTWVRIPEARSARGLRQFRPRSMSRGRRESRVRAAPAVPCAEMEESAHEHTGEAEAIRPSLRDGLRLNPDIANHTLPDGKSRRRPPGHVRSASDSRNCPCRCPIGLPLQAGEGSCGNQSVPTLRRDDLHRQTGRCLRDPKLPVRRSVVEDRPVNV